MKTNNFQKLTRTEMKEIMAGNRPSISLGGATVTCNDGTDYPVSSCNEAEMKKACAGNNGWKICSGEI